MSDKCTCAEVFGEDPNCVLHGIKTQWALENTLPFDWQNHAIEAADEITRLCAEIDALKASIADEREDAARAMKEACLCPATWQATWPKEAIRNIDHAQFRSRQP